MQKKLIALAVAGLVSGAAFADAANITLYGIADVAYQYSGSSLTNNVKSQSAINDGGQDGSRVGFKGTEDLGNGLKAFFKIEQRFYLDTAGAPTGRNSNVGLMGSWGTIVAGSFGSVHDDYNGYSEAGGMGWGNGVVHKLGTGDARNAVEYISPNFNGLEFKVGASTQYDGGAEVAANSSVNTDQNRRAMFGAVAYANGPIKAALTYDRSSYQVESTGSDSASEWMGAFSYDFGVVRAGIGYDKTNFKTDDVRTTWRVTAAAPITANDTIGISYSRGKTDFDAAGAQDAKASGWGLSYSHAMSKRTNVYATYGQVSQNKAAELAGAGSIGDYSIDGTKYERAFKVGMRHFF